MPIITIRQVGNLGAIPDIPAHELPPEAWSKAQNVGFDDGYAFRQKGETQVEGTPTVVPHYLASSPSAVSSYWTYTDLDDVYAVTEGVHTKITRAAGIYTGEIDNVWTGNWLSGISILNNGVEPPQMWNPIDAGTLLTDLSNWPAGTTTKVMRGYQNFLFALNVVKPAGSFPTLVKWSHPADPGTVPTSWDEADATKLTGELPLSETPGFIVDGRALGSSFMVYKEDAIHRLDRVSTNAIFSNRALTQRTGLMGVGCAQEYARGQHVFLTLDADVAITDGQQINTITNKRIRKYLEQFISGEFRTRCFVVTNGKTKEAYICYPRTGDSYCTEAAVWNWEDNVWSFKDLSDTLDIKAGVYAETAGTDSWDSDTDSWDSDSTVWDERTYVAQAYRLIGASVTDNELREFGVGQTLGGTSYTSVLERTGLAIAGVDRQGQPVVDTTKTKLVTEFYPIINVAASASFQISMGAGDNPNGPIVWEGPYDFDPLTETKLDFLVEGKYIALRIASSSEVDWKLQGYAMKVDLVGEDH